MAIREGGGRRKAANTYEIVAFRRTGRGDLDWQPCRGGGRDLHRRGGYPEGDPLLLPRLRKFHTCLKRLLCGTRVRHKKRRGKHQARGVDAAKQPQGMLARLLWAMAA